MHAHFNNLIRKISELPQETQDNILFFWNDDVENEINYDKKLSDSSDKLEILAKEALAEYNKGKTIEAGWEEI